ncbi:carbohydrate ABC transporter permease [Paenibacillus sp. P25]|nr:carbohydrate ABC transporter permease [Paenibacillus sp. P25]
MNPLKPTAGERWFDAVNIVFLACLSLAFLIPFLTVLSTSFISAEESMRRGAFVLIPEKLDFAAYDLLLNRGPLIYNAYKVTLFKVVVGTLLNLVFTSTLAYGLSRRKPPGRNALVLIIFLTMIFHGGLIPTYMLIDNLGIKDTLWVLVLPGLVSAWNLFILRNFFMSLPEELEESAIMDGASPLVILWKIVIPLSMPAIATIGLFYAVHHWNDWFGASIYINDPAKSADPGRHAQHSAQRRYAERNAARIRQRSAACGDAQIGGDYCQHASHFVRIPVYPALFRERGHGRLHQGVEGSFIQRRRDSDAAGAIIIYVRAGRISYVSHSNHTGDDARDGTRFLRGAEEWSGRRR